MPSGREPSGVSGPGKLELVVVLLVLVTGAEVIIFGEPIEQFTEEEGILQEDVVI